MAFDNEYLYGNNWDQGTSMDCKYPFDMTACQPPSPECSSISTEKLLPHCRREYTFAAPLPVGAPITPMMGSGDFDYDGAHVPTEWSMALAAQYSPATDSTLSSSGSAMLDCFADSTALDMDCLSDEYASEILTDASCDEHWSTESAASPSVPMSAGGPASHYDSGDLVGQPANENLACEWSSTSRESRAGRGRAKSQPKQKFPCTHKMCKEVFARQEHRKRHVDTVHNGGRTPYRCPIAAIWGPNACTSMHHPKRSDEKGEAGHFNRSDNRNQHYDTHSKLGSGKARNRIHCPEVLAASMRYQALHSDGEGGTAADVQSAANSKKQLIEHQKKYDRGMAAPNFHLDHRTLNRVFEGRWGHLHDALDDESEHMCWEHFRADGVYDGHRYTDGTLTKPLRSNTSKEKVIYTLCGRTAPYPERPGDSRSKAESASVPKKFGKSRRPASRL